MVRFLNGSYQDIANVIELQHYVVIEDMLHMTIRVKEQPNKKGHKSFSNSEPLKSN